MAPLYPSWYSSPPTGNVVPPCAVPDSVNFLDQPHGSGAPLVVTKIAPRCSPHPVLMSTVRTAPRKPPCSSAELSPLTVVVATRQCYWGHWKHAKMGLRGSGGTLVCID